MRVIIIASLPASVLLALVARPFTLLLFGEGWLPMVPLLQLLVIYGILRPVFDNHADFFVAVGRPRIPGRIVLIQTLVLVAACPAAVCWFRAEGAAVTVGLVMALGVFLACRHARRWVDVSYTKIFLVPGVATGAAALATAALSRVWDPASSWEALLLRGATFLTIFLLVLLPLEGRTLREEYSYFVAQFRNRSVAPPAEGS